jgi:glycine/D-amino acid oxidase-like deaminating enzyme
MHRIVVVGGGVAGIVTATHLSRRLTRSKLADILKTGRLPNSISATWGASCHWLTTLPTAHSAPTAFSAEDS